MKKLIIACLFVLVSGCGTLSPSEQLGVDLLLIKTTGTYIEKGDIDLRKEKVIKVVDSISAVVDVTTEVSLGTLNKVIDQSIDWKNVSPADKTIINLLINAALDKARRNVHFEKGTVQTVTIQHILNVIKSTALSY
jgi:hypothetical protein